MNKLKFNVNGNIGAGKSTYTKLMKQHIMSSDVCEEPVQKWLETVDSKNENILQKFYNEPKEYAFLLQNFACITRMMKSEEILTTTKASNIFYDRFIDTDKNVFFKMLCDDGMISEIEQTMYNSWYDFYTKYVRPAFFDFTIYLRCEPEVAYNRIMKRNRVEEKDITLEYITKVHQYHEDWLMNSNMNNVLVIDCNKDFENNAERQLEVINITKQLISSIVMKRASMVNPNLMFENSYC